jgi:hypothetical protein
MKVYLGRDVGALHCQSGSSRDALALVAAITGRSLPETQPRAAMACLLFAAWRPQGGGTTGLLIVENSCYDWLLGMLQRIAHHRAHARPRALLLFQLRAALVSVPGSHPALCSFGAPLWG